MVGARVAPAARGGLAGAVQGHAWPRPRHGRDTAASQRLECVSPCRRLIHLRAWRPLSASCGCHRMTITILPTSAFVFARTPCVCVAAGNHLAMHGLAGSLGAALLSRQECCRLLGRRQVEEQRLGRSRRALLGCEARLEISLDDCIFTRSSRRAAILIGPTSLPYLTQEFADRILPAMAASVVATAVNTEFEFGAHTAAARR